MKAAFATQDLVHVDAHFGWCPRLAVYEVTPEGAALAATHEFPPGVEDGTEDKLKPRLAALEGCAVLYTSAIGGSAAGQVRSLGVQPAKVAEGSAIEALLLQLRQVMNGNPPPWLRKAMAGAGPRRFDPEEVATP
jgi:nitrogen fixation protein NifX